jgi:CBS domain-containing protein
METDFLALPAASTLADTMVAQHAAATQAQRLLPVVDGDGSVVGVVTRGDIRKRMDEEGGGALQRSISELLRAETMDVYPDETLRVVVYRMAGKGITSMPVVERGTRRLLGIVSLDDLLKARTRHLEEERRREQVLRFRYFRPGEPSTKLPEEGVALTTSEYVDLNISGR